VAADALHAVTVCVLARGHARCERQFVGVAGKYARRAAHRVRVLQQQRLVARVEHVRAGATIWQGVSGAARPRRGPTSLYYQAFFEPGAAPPARAGSLADFVLAQHASIPTYNVDTRTSVDAQNTLFIDNSAAGTSGRYSLLVMHSSSPALREALARLCYVLEFEVRMRVFSQAFYKAGAGPAFIAFVAASPPQDVSGIEYQFAAGIDPVYAPSAFFADNFSFAFQRNAYTSQQCALYACRYGCDASCRYAYAGAHVPFTDNDAPWLRASYSVVALNTSTASTRMRVETEEQRVLLDASFTVTSTLGTRMPYGLGIGSARTSIFVRRLRISASSTCAPTTTATPSLSPTTTTATPSLRPTTAMAAPSLRPTTTMAQPSSSPSMAQPSSSPSMAQPSSNTTTLATVPSSNSPTAQPSDVPTQSPTLSFVTAQMTVSPATLLPIAPTHALRSNVFVIITIILVATLALLVRISHRVHAAAHLRGIRRRTHLAYAHTTAVRRHLPADERVYDVVPNAPASWRTRSPIVVPAEDILYVESINDDDD
jgi:hypothetical protein